MTVETYFTEWQESFDGTELYCRVQIINNTRHVKLVIKKTDVLSLSQKALSLLMKAKISAAEKELQK